MRYLFLYFFIFLLPFFSCSLFMPGSDTNEGKEPSYTARIAWISDTSPMFYPYMTLEGSSVYIYEERKLGNGYEYNLAKLDANTGNVIWRAEIPHMQLCPPKVIDNYVYVFVAESLIYSFNVQTGEISAIIETDTENRGMEIKANVIINGDYLYFGIGVVGQLENYLMRLDTAVIDRIRNPSETQYITPEIVWTPESGRSVWAEPVIKDNIIYCLTFAGLSLDPSPVELAGINMDTKQVVWHEWLDYERGREQYSLLIHEDILYILADSLSAYNLDTKEQLFLKTFAIDTPESEQYSAGFSATPRTYYDGRIYYTNNQSDLFSRDGMNIICIDAKTGKLVWGDLPPETESLGTNPVIINNRMYVPHFYGRRVYNPKNGKLIGVDTSFCGSGENRNLLYNNYMITVRPDRNTGIGKVVAVDIGG